MIIYDISLAGILSRVTNFTGSVFPSACVIAFLPALAAFFFRLLYPDLFSWIGNDLDQAWSAFSFFVGFLLVFRTTQAYNRFWDGCQSLYKMGAEWQDSGSNLISFTKLSKNIDDAIVVEWCEQTATLISMLHASALAALRFKEGEDGEFGISKNIADMYSAELKWELGIKEYMYDEEQQKEVEVVFNKQDYLDYEDEHLFLTTSDDLCNPKHLDAKARETLRELSAQDRVSILIGWIQVHIVNGIKSNVLQIAPPILTRAFQELSQGMTEYHNALKVAEIPFPFPYAQICDTLLLLHGTLVPVVSSNWIKSPLLAGLFTFVQVLVLWALNLVASEIEMPFGDDANDLDLLAQQNQFNRRMLIQLTDEANDPPRPEGADITHHHHQQHIHHHSNDNSLNKLTGDNNQQQNQIQNQNSRETGSGSGIGITGLNQNSTTKLSIPGPPGGPSTGGLQPPPAPTVKRISINAPGSLVFKKASRDTGIGNNVNVNETADDQSVSEDSKTSIADENRHITKRKKLKQIDQANTFYISKDDHIFNLIKDRIWKRADDKLQQAAASAVETELRKSSLKSKGNQLEETSDMKGKEEEEGMNLNEIVVGSKDGIMKNEKDM